MLNEGFSSSFKLWAKWNIFIPVFKLGQYSFKIQSMLSFFMTFAQFQWQHKVLMLDLRIFLRRRFSSLEFILIWVIGSQFELINYTEKYYQKTRSKESRQLLFSSTPFYVFLLISSISYDNYRLNVGNVMQLVRIYQTSKKYFRFRYSIICLFALVWLHT